MQVIGFNFTKIVAEKDASFKKGAINTNIEFSDFQKDEIALLKETSAGKLTFKFSVNYTDTISNKKDSEKDSKKSKKETDSKKAEVSFEGDIILSLKKEELKNLQKSWKKKQIPPNVQLPLYNLILKKCSIKAASLADDINLPTHLPIPQIRPKQNQ